MTSARRVLLLAGSTEASELARRFATYGDLDVVVSYAGRTRERVATPGRVRVGGFGGVDGLKRFLDAESIDVLVDATHPFAAQMPHHAARACAETGIPRTRVLRPGWDPEPADRWHDVEDLDAAAATLAVMGARRVFLTTGRQELAPFAGLRDTWFLVRAIEAPATMPLARATVVLARGPFDDAGELALMTEHTVDTVVTKNSGGDAAAAKLRVARALGLPVVMVARPYAPPGPTVRSVDDALAWLDALRG